MKYVYKKLLSKFGCLGKTLAATFRLIKIQNVQTF
jgi:hypothetical protein